VINSGDGNLPSTKISKIPLTNPRNIEKNWATVLFNSQALAIDSGYLYAVNSGDGNLLSTTISKIPLTNPGDIETVWATGLSDPAGLAIDSGNLYVTNYGNYHGTTISKISLANLGDIEANWATGLYAPTGLAIDSGYLYVANFGNGTISKVRISSKVGISSNSPVQIPCNFPIFYEKININSGIIKYKKNKDKKNR